MGISLGLSERYLLYNNEPASPLMITDKFSLNSPEKELMYEQMSREIDEYDDMDELKSDFKQWIRLCLKQKEMAEDLLKSSLLSEVHESTKN